MKENENIIDFKTASKELKELDALDKIGSGLEAILDMQQSGTEPSIEDFDDILGSVPDDFPELSEMIKGVRDTVASKKENN